MVVVVVAAVVKGRGGRGGGGAMERWADARPGIRWAHRSSFGACKVELSSRVAPTEQGHDSGAEGPPALLTEVAEELEHR